MNENIIANAIELAVFHHSGQKRRTGIDYIVHPAKVAEHVRSMTENMPYYVIESFLGASLDEILAAAWLHDTIEDTKITENEIINKTSKKVYDLILELTSDKEEIKKIGKSKYLIQKMEKMSPGALFLKFCDRYENVSGLTLVGEKFSDNYCKETERILEGLTIPKFWCDVINSAFDDLVSLIRKELENYENFKRSFK